MNDAVKEKRQPNQETKPCDQRHSKNILNPTQSHVEEARQWVVLSKKVP